MLRTICICLALLLLAGPAFAESMEEGHVAKSKRFYEEIINQGKFDLIDEFLSKDFVEHETLPGDLKGREGVKQFFMSMREAFPDLKMVPEFYVAQGDKVVAYVTMSGTQKKDFMGMPSSGKAFKTQTVDIIRFVDGVAVEHWGVTDSGAMMQQLAPDEPEKAKGE